MGNLSINYNSLKLVLSKIEDLISHELSLETDEIT